MAVMNRHDYSLTQCFLVHEKSSNRITYVAHCTPEGMSTLVSKRERGRSTIDTQGIHENV